jgi:DNA-binding MurR/RpiR family transcriptional regulator
MDHSRADGGPMQEVLDRLSAEISELSPQLRLAARRVLDHPNEVAVLSMRAFAARAQVNPPTMMRLARRLGFDGYEAFRAEFQAPLVRTSGTFRARASWLQELATAEGGSAVAHGLAEAASANIADFYRGLDMAQVVRVADLLQRAPTSYLIAVSAFYWMAAYFQFLGRMALPRLRLPRANGTSLTEGLISIERGDVALAFSASPYALQTLQAARFAKERGATLIALTDSRASPLTPLADEVLIVPTASPQFFPSMIAVGAAIETLIAVAVSRSDQATIERISELEALRVREGGYTVS